MEELAWLVAEIREEHGLGAAPPPGAQGNERGDEAVGVALAFGAGGEPSRSASLRPRSGPCCAGGCPTARRRIRAWQHRRGCPGLLLHPPGASTGSPSRRHRAAVGEATDAVARTRARPGAPRARPPACCGRLTRGQVGAGGGEAPTRPRAIGGGKTPARVGPVAQPPRRRRRAQSCGREGREEEGTEKIR